MARLFWDGGGVDGSQVREFDPDAHRQTLAGLSALAGVELALRRDTERDPPARASAPVRAGSRRTDWVVAALNGVPNAQRVAQVAADLVGRALTAEDDIASLAMEVADRYEELNFLYTMGESVGALLDEDAICAFVVQRAARLMDCERASVMVVDPDTHDLRIRAAVGIPEAIADGVSVKPGERISGRVFERGAGVVVNAGDPMPDDSLNSSDLRSADCFLSVPLKTTQHGGGEETVLGVINMTRKRSGSGFTASDLKLVNTVAATTAAQIMNCRLLSAERERQRLEHELALAAQIQLSLLPEHPLRVGSVEAGGCCRPARHVGGDLFDYWVQDDRLCMVVADVSGHDIGAALMATALRSVVRSEAAHRRSVADLMDRVNAALFADLVRSELFVSAFYAELGLATGELVYCRAGHPMPLLLGADRETQLDTEGMLFGITEDGGFEQQSLIVRGRDALVLYTDGLMEAMDVQGHQFGIDGVYRAAKDRLAQPPKNIADHIIEAATAHSRDPQPADDMTVMVVRADAPED